MLSQFSIWIVYAVSILTKAECDHTLFEKCEFNLQYELSCPYYNLTTLPNITHPYNEKKEDRLLIDFSHNNLQVVPKSLFTTVFLQMNAENKTESLCGDTLDFSHNEITDIESGAFQDEPECLKQLILTHNKLNRIPSLEIQKLSNLKKLIVSSNNLTSIDKSSLKNLTNLTRLLLNDCSIQTIESYAFQYLQNLKFLELSGNLLINLEPNTFSGLSKLLTLDLSYMTINHIVSETFNSVSRFCLVTRNQVMSVNISEMQNATVLKEITNKRKTFNIEEQARRKSTAECSATVYMTDNISSWSVKNFSYPEVADNCGNNTKTCSWRIVCKDFLEAPKITVHGNNTNLKPNSKYKSFYSTKHALSFSLSNFQALPANLFTERFTHISDNDPEAKPIPICIGSLDLSHNKIKNISDQTFNSEPGCLQALDLSANKLTEIPTKALQPLKALVELRLSYNNFGTVKAESFKNLSVLEILSFENCNITSIEPNAFKGLSNLKTLKLAVNNILKQLTNDVMGLPQVTVVMYERRRVSIGVKA